MLIHRKEIILVIRVMELTFVLGKSATNRSKIVFLCNFNYIFCMFTTTGKVASGHYIFNQNTAYEKIRIGLVGLDPVGK